MFDLSKEMGNILACNVYGNTSYLRDVATPKDASFIQTNVVRIQRQKRGVYPGLPPA